MKRLLEEADVTDLERALLRSVEADEPPADGADRLFAELMNRSEATAPVVPIRASSSPRKVPTWVWLAAAVLFGVGALVLDRSRQEKVKIVEEAPTVPVPVTVTVPTPVPVPIASMPPATEAQLPSAPAVVSAAPSAAPSHMVMIKSAPSASGPIVVGKGQTLQEAMQKAWAERDAGASDITSQGAFNKGDAPRGLGKLNASACAGAAGPNGAGHLSVTFGSDGAVQSVVVDPPFQGTARGDCMADQARAVHVPPFEGTPVRVGKSFVFN